MKTIRKVLAALISVAMLMAFALPAGAADPTYSITINNSTAGHTYEAYQIFAGDLSGTGADAVLSNVTWGNGVTDAGKTNLGDAASKAEELTNEQLVKAFAQNVGGYLQNPISSSAYDNNAKLYKFTGLSAGYYLVKDASNPTSDASTRFILQVVDNVTVAPKASVPTVEKKVYEESYASDDNYDAVLGTGTYGTGYNDVADYNIGDNVKFELIGTLPSTLEDYSWYQYTFNDTISKGLTFNNDVTVTIDGKTVGTNYYKVTGPTDIDGSTDKTITIEFKSNENKYLLGAKTSTGDDIQVTSASKVIVTYTAKLNDKAVIGLPGNPNEVYLTYSNNPNQGGSGDTGKTPEDKVIVFTYELDTTKVDAQNTETKLENAEFVLYKEVSGTTTYATVASGNVTGWTTTEGDATTLVSDANGLFKVAGLDDGTYYLKETKAPAGYNKLADPVKIVITATTTNNQSWTGTASDALTKLEISVKGATAVEGDKSTGVVKATIANNTGAVLPSTGGIGTTLFYVIGGLLMAGAAVLLITKKRMSGKND